MRAHRPVTSGEVSGRSPAVEAALARSLFVIPSINGGSLLRRMLPTLRLPLHTVVVLDQGSVDDTEAVCRKAGVRLVQLGRPHTYTEASNIGARMARETGCAFVFISNNDIAFTTDVAAELLAEMLEDSRLGIVAPSQVIVDEKIGQRFLAHRAEWHLDTMLFTHDVEALDEDVGRLEADLCELTCAAIRMTAIDEIGFLDDDYGFYYEDADFCFRLRQAGYSCAYLPRSQIEHYTSSTFSAGMSERKRAYMAKNMDLFAGKHLGYAVGRLAAETGAEPPTSGATRHLPRYLERFGLIDPRRPSLVVGAPGRKPLDYLLADASAFAGAAPRLLSAYRGLIATSESGRRTLVDAGFEGIGLARLGVETDLYHPWAAAARPFAETTFLWCGRGGAGHGLSAVLEAWAVFRADRPDSRLLAVGTGLLDALRHAPASLRQWRGSIIADYPGDGITVRELSTPLSDEGWAKLYRGVDVLLWTDPQADCALAAAMACGTLAIAPAVGPEGDLVASGALALDGDGSSGAWRPGLPSLLSRLHEAHTIGDTGRRALARRALPLIRSRHTWRSTCAGLHESLAEWQQPRDMRDTLRRQREAGAAEDLYHAHEAAAADAPLSPPRPAADRVSPALRPEPVTSATPAVIPSSHVLARQIGRVRAARRAFIALRQTRGRRATFRMVRHALARRSRLLLRRLLPGWLPTRGPM